MVYNTQPAKFKFYLVNTILHKVSKIAGLTMSILLLLQMNPTIEYDLSHVTHKRMSYCFNFPK